MDNTATMKYAPGHLVALSNNSAAGC